MAPRRKKVSPIRPIKRVMRIKVEQNICKKKLEKLEHEESLATEDRFTSIERRQLLDAYNEVGYKVFQDTKLLARYFPNRRESDLKGLLQKLKAGLYQMSQVEQRPPTPLDQWQNLCQQLMSSFAKDKKLNLDDVFADALIAEAEAKKLDEAESSNHDSTNDVIPNYPQLLDSFAHLLMGKFPDTIGPLEAQISMKLFDHINSVVDSFDCKTALAPLEQGTWLDSTIDERKRRLDMAFKGLEEIDGRTKKCPTLRDIGKNRNMEALCLELPKIKRITDVLNPLFLNESLLSTLME